MSFYLSPELEAYNEALAELFCVNRSFALLAQGMGQPVWNRSIPTAQVEYMEREGKVRFVFNPEWLLTLTVEEAAAIIAHEAHHVWLSHLEESMSGKFPNLQALKIAHECIINDTVATVFRMPLPGTHYRGPDTVGRDTTPCSSQQVYDLLTKAQEDEDESDENKDSEDAEKSEDPQKGEDGPKDGSEEGEGKAEGDPQEDEAGGKNEKPEDAEGQESDCDEGGTPDEEGASGGDQPDEDATEGQSQSGEGSGKGDQQEDPAGEPGGSSDGDAGDETDAPSAGESQPGDDNLIGEAPSANGQENKGAEGGKGEEPQDAGDPGASCGGVQIPAGVTQQDLKQAVTAILVQAAKEGQLKVDELVKELAQDSGGGFSITGLDLTQLPQLTTERMNWRKLLAKINPKVMESGRRKRKTRNNWTTYNRRMGSVYPKVILPKVEHVEPRKADDDGDTLPVMVIALDLSGSIPRELVGTLQGLLNEIPEKLIKAYPCTWADYCYPYEEGSNVASGGTNINSVVQYVEKVQRETGTDPYVLVITDGEFPRDHRRPGKDWYFMAVNKKSVKTLTDGYSGGYYRNWGAQVAPGEDCYLVDDFKI